MPDLARFFEVPYRHAMGAERTINATSLCLRINTLCELTNKLPNFRLRSCPMRRNILHGDF
jgi:hypothetical protein